MTQLIGRSKVLEVIEQAKTTQKSSLCLILGLTTTEKLSGVSNGSLSGSL